MPSSDHRGIDIDRYRGVVFPNRIREQRLRNGQPTLLAFAAALPDIPYVRLAKIERGEVFARAEELTRIAAALGIAASDLLIDVAAPDFDVADWFAPFADSVVIDNDAEARMAVLLAAAMRAKRHADARLTASVIDTEHHIPPVILSRIENAQKGLSRWNAPTMATIVGFFGVADEEALRRHLEAAYERGDLAGFTDGIMDEAARRDRTARRIAALRAELTGLPRRVPPLSPSSTTLSAPVADRRFVPVYGVALDDGLIAMTPAGVRVEVPMTAGPRAFGLRVCRPTVGAGLPGQATVIVDPDRYPQAGGLALVRDGEGYRIVTVSIERDGTMHGFSITPAREIALDTLAPADIAAIIAASYC